MVGDVSFAHMPENKIVYKDQCFQARYPVRNMERFQLLLPYALINIMSKYFYKLAIQIKQYSLCTYTIT
jgi:hypothetical protein